MPTPSAPPAAASEDDVTALLSNPAAYPERPARVDVIETHCARVFLAGREAYKVKKHVRLPFLDFSTLEQRHQTTSREIEINQPHAPAIYIGLVPITRDASGALRLGGRGGPLNGRSTCAALSRMRFLPIRPKKGRCRTRFARLSLAWRRVFTVRRRSQQMSMARKI